MSRAVVALVATLLSTAALAGENGSSSWAVPAPGTCAPEGGLSGASGGQAPPPLPFATGDVLEGEKLAAVAPYLPKEVWAHRDQFFPEGTKLEVGACFADYSPPAFYREAGEALAGKAQVLENGGLVGYVAGQPFPLSSLDAADPEAGIKWAWNVEFRYQGAGFRGPFRTSDVVGRTGRAEPFEGEIFKLNLSHRADLKAPKYEDKSAKGRLWVAGGTFFAPYAARDYAWRQFRSLDTLKEVDRTDDLHAYLPDWRRVRRLPSTNVEGLYMPSFSVGVTAAQSATGSGPTGGGAEGAASRSNVDTTTTITTKRSGFEGLEIRPLLYDYRVLGERDVLAPINASRPAYPESKDRDFGPWGLSFGSDRWDLRRAVVLEGRARGAAEKSQAQRVLYYVDLQTGQPLYYTSYRYHLAKDAGSGVIDVGVFVGRWSEERGDYPGWPDDKNRPVRVIDPVGAAFANVEEDGGWRRESWTMVSTSPAKREARQMISVNELSKRR